jgi:peptidyl-prolyl cis-trans isomerase C
MLALALPVAAQQIMPVPSADDQKKTVAVVNGEVITLGMLDDLYNRLSGNMREQYDKSGGKNAFLDNYIGKRLLVQEAIKSGFDKRPDVQADMKAAAEGALFDRYVRDVVATNVLTDAEMKKFYDDNHNLFQIPEQIKVRHIVVVGGGIGPNPKTDEDAQNEIKKVAMELRAATLHINAKDAATAATARRIAFEQAAQKYSEDASAQSGGDLGWQARGNLDPQFEEAAYALEPGTISGVVKTRFGYHLIFVEAKKPGGLQDYEEAKPKIRSFLLSQHSADILGAVTRLTRELRDASKVAVYSENIR